MSQMRFSGAFSFGTSSRKVFDVKNEQDPSPFQYQNVDIKSDKTKGVSFTKQAKIKSPKKCAPPLGHYKLQYKQINKEVPGKSMLRKPKSNIIYEKLGPGAYNIVNDRLQTITHTFGYKNDNEQQIQQNSEEKSIKIIDKQIINKPNFSKSDRKIDTIKNNRIPGPGEYSLDINCITAKNSISFAKGLRPLIIEKFRVKNPGPGQYENSTISNESQTKSEICHFGGRAQDYDLKYRSQFPSPGSYDPSMPTNSQQVSFKKAKRDDLILKQRYPGPGNYNPDQKQSGNQYSIGNTERSVNILRSKDNPGPGQYNIKSQAVEGFSSSLRCRRKENHKLNNVPGPGMYNVISQNNGRYSLIGTSDHLNNKDVLYKTSLGPGQYEQSTCSNGPKYSMGKLIKQKTKDNLKEYDFMPQNSVGYIPQYLSHEVRKDI